MNFRKVLLKKLVKGSKFYVNRELYVVKGYTDTGLICTYKFNGDMYRIFDVDAVVEIEEY